MNETSGTTMTDISANAFDGSYVGSPSLNATGGLVDSQAGGAVDFSGANNVLGRTSTSCFNAGAPYTIEMLLNPDTVSGHKRILVTASGANVFLSLNQTSGETGSLWGWDNTGGTWRRLAPNNTLAASTWYHIVLTITAGNSWQVYTNNTAQTAFSFSGAQTMNGVAEDIAGDFSDDNNAFDGRIQCVSAWQSVLSSTVIARHYTAALLNARRMGAHRGVW